MFTGTLNYRLLHRNSGLNAFELALLLFIFASSLATFAR